MQTQEPAWQQTETHARWLILRRKHDQEQNDLRLQANQGQATFNNRVTTARAAMLARQQQEEAEFWSNNFTRNVGNDNVGANAQRPDARPNAAAQGQVGGQPIVHPRLPDVPPKAPTASSSTPSSASKAPAVPSRVPQTAGAASTPTRPRLERTRSMHKSTPVIDLTEDESTESSIPNTKTPASSSRKPHAPAKAGRVRPLIWPNKSNFLDLSGDDSNKSWTKKPSVPLHESPDVGGQKPVEKPGAPSNKSFAAHATGMERSGDGQANGSMQGTVSGNGFTRKTGAMNVKTENRRPIVIEDPVPIGFTAVRSGLHTQATNAAASSSSAKQSSSTTDTAPRHEQQTYASYEDYLKGTTAVQPFNIPSERGFKRPSQHSRVWGDEHSQHVSGSASPVATVSTLSSSSKKRKVVNLSSDEEHEFGPGQEALAPSSETFMMKKQKQAELAKKATNNGNIMPLMFKKTKPGDSDSATRDAQRTFARVAMSKAPLSYTRPGSRGGYVMSEDDEEVSSPLASHRSGAATFGPGTRVTLNTTTAPPAYTNQRKAKQSAKETIQHLCSEEEAFRTEQVALYAERQGQRIKSQAGYNRHTGGNHNSRGSKGHDMSHRMRSMSITPSPSQPTPSKQPRSGFEAWSNARATGDRHVAKYLPPFVESGDDDEGDVKAHHDIKFETQWHTRAHRGIKTGGQAPTRGGKRK